MRRIVIIFCGFFLAAALLAAPSARADESSALDQLTAEERAHLEQQVPGWEEFSTDRREKIALTVLRIRQMPEEKRRALLERIQRLKHGREAGRGPRPGRLEHHLDPRRRRSHRQRGHLMKAVSTVFWSEVPEGTRAAIEGVFDRRDRDRVAMAFLRRLLGRIAKQRAAEGVPPIPISPDMPPERLQGLEALRAKAEAGDARALEKLAHMSVFHELQRAAAALTGDGPPDEAAIRRLGAAVRERYPAAFAESMADLAKAAESVEALRSYAPEGHRGPRGRRGGSSPEHQARRLLESLEQSGELVRKHPALREHVQRLRRELRKILGEGHAPDRMGHGGAGPDRPGRAGGPGGRRGPPGGGRGARRGPPVPPDEAPPVDDEGK